MAVPASPDSSHSSPGIAGWRIILRIAGALLAVAFFSYWAAAGFNTGWTKDLAAIKKIDEVTGIEFVEYKKHFVPGLEFLVAGVGFGLGISAITFFSRKTKSTSRT